MLSINEVTVEEHIYVSFCRLNHGVQHISLTFLIFTLFTLLLYVPCQGQM